MTLCTHMSRLITKSTKWHVRPAKTQISLDIRPVWSESSLSAWRMLRPFAIHWAHSEDSDQTGRTVILLVLSWGGSYMIFIDNSLMCCRSDARESQTCSNNNNPQKHVAQDRGDAEVIAFLDDIHVITDGSSEKAARRETETEKDVFVAYHDLSKCVIKEINFGSYELSN